MSARFAGVLAEFEDAGELIRAAEGLRAHHYTRFEAFSPYPIHQLDDLIESPNPLPAMAFAGGLLGSVTAWVLQTYIAIIDYPLNIGGRPLYSWPSFIVILFELTILFASITIFVGMLALCGLPRPHHPVFGVRRFRAATRNGFFIAVEASDPLFDPQITLRQMEELQPREVWTLDED
jgi:hypothetical protein